ncbi:hypothetical protein B379_09560 [Anoxybacillus ayderensis G10]|nr:hypothetical protein B379_09560 [Anoxybacillus ayderensis G10]
MLKNIDPEKFALAVISSTVSHGDSYETIAKEKLKLYVTAFDEAVNYNKTVISENKGQALKEFYGSK